MCLFWYTPSVEGYRSWYLDQKSFIFMISKDAMFNESLMLKGKI